MKISFNVDAMVLWNHVSKLTSLWLKRKISFFWLLLVILWAYSQRNKINTAVYFTCQKQKERVSLLMELLPTKPNDFVDFKGIYKYVVTSSSFWAQKLENFNNKNRIYLAFWCVFKDIKHVLREFFYLKKNFFLSLSVSHHFKNPQITFENP